MGRVGRGFSVFDQMVLYGRNNKYKGKPLFRGGITSSGIVQSALPIDNAKGQAMTRLSAMPAAIKRLTVCSVCEGQTRTHFSTPSLPRRYSCLILPWHLHTSHDRMETPCRIVLMHCYPRAGSPKFPSSLETWNSHSRSPAEFDLYRRSRRVFPELVLHGFIDADTDEHGRPLPRWRPRGYSGLSVPHRLTQQLVSRFQAPRFYLWRPRVHAPTPLHAPAQS